MTTKDKVVKKPCDTIEQNEEEGKKKRITATEMMVNDMQEEEYYRIKHTPNEWIEEKMKEFEETFDNKKMRNTKGEKPDVACFRNGYNARVAENWEENKKVKDFLKSSLTQQKEAIEKEWEDKAEKLGNDIINEIRKEVEDRKFNELVNGKLTEVVMLEDIKTFLDKIKT